jgi:hypothetical protein
MHHADAVDFDRHAVEVDLDRGDCKELVGDIRA